MKNTLFLLVPALLLGPLATRAQTGGVRIGTAGAPDASAVLDLHPDAPTAPKGFLPPRLSLAQRDAIASPAPGLTIYNTDTNQLNVWNGTSWGAYLIDNSDRGPVAFAYTGAPQTYTVPAGVRSLTVDMAGGAGGVDKYRNPGGLGGRVQATLVVMPGEVLTICVAGAGTVATPGYNGGGGSTYQGSGGGGGGASDLRQGGASLANRVLVAGGGGGAGNNSGGACGGGLTACTAINDPYGSTGGQGGSQSSAGAGGTGSPPGTAGTANVGGDGGYYSGGGGGGYFGGGSGGGGTGGGGGSSFVGPGTSGVVHTQGVQAGNGYVLLTPAIGPLPAPVLDASHFVNVPGDNLGNHTATQSLNLTSNALTGTGADLGSAVGLGVRADGGLNLGQNAPGVNFLVGYQAGQNTTGGQNTFIGYQGGLSNTTGSNNTAVGFGSGPTTGALTNAAAFGYKAQVSQNNSLVLGGTGTNAVRVGIGTTAPRGQLDVASGDTYLVANPDNGSAQTTYLPGHLFLAPYSGTSGTAYVQARVPNPTSSTSLGLTLRTTNGTTLVDALTLSANGDAALARNVAVAGTLGVTGNTTLAGNLDVAGSVGIGLVSNFLDSTLGGGKYGQRVISCPAGTYLLTGGGGHRDFNIAQQDIVVNYSGPDPDNPTSGWVLRVTNTSSSDRAVRIYCNCARIR